MNRFVVAFAFLACVSRAPQYLNHSVSTVGHPPVASAPVVTGQTHQTYAAGLLVVEQPTDYRVVGSQHRELHIRADASFPTPLQYPVPPFASLLCPVPQTDRDPVPVPVLQ